MYDQSGLEKLLTASESSDEAERLRAEQALRMAGPQVIDILLEMGEAEAVRGQQAPLARVGKRCAGLVMAPCAAIGVCVGLLSDIIPGLRAAAKRISGTTFELGWGISFSLMHRFSGSISVRRQIARVLLYFDDIRAVGPFSEALWFTDDTLRDDCASALQRLLPQVKRDDVALLNYRQRSCLYQILYIKHAERQASLMMAVLHVLAVQNDVISYIFVNRLADTNATTPNEERVRAAARSALKLFKLPFGRGSGYFGG